MTDTNALLQTITVLEGLLKDSREVLTHMVYMEQRLLTLVEEHEYTALATLHRVWRQGPQADRLRFLIEMLTPAERRALACGLDAAEAPPC